MTTSSKHSGDENETPEARAKSLVRDHFEAINTRDRGRIEDLHADDVVVHSAGRELAGIDAVVRDWWAQLEAIPDLEDTIEMLLADGDLVAVRYRTTGTHEGEFRGIEPTGTPVEITSMAMIRADGTEIGEIWNHPDRFALFRQLGLIEDPRP